MDEAAQARRAELAHFLRSRRARVSPAAAGLPVAGRRRTPGLRREELAFVAGISASWYTWLEQGRAITVSAQMLESLARALHLTAEERTHLFLLARGEMLATSTPATLTVATVDAATQQLLDALEPYPAYVVNAQWEVIGWNRVACHVFLDFAALAGRDRNLLWLLFTHPTLRGRYEDWEVVARRMLALFRVSTAQAIGDGWYRELIEELCDASREFRAWWPQHELTESPRDVKVVNHPVVGRLMLQPNPLQVAHAAAAWLLVYTPAPETDTRAKLEHLLVLDSDSEARYGSRSSTSGT